MQPYQKATEEIGRQGELPFKLASNAASVAGAAASAYLGGGAINKVLPFLSKYIPDELVKKGLSKIDPRYGKFIDKALSAGKSIEEVKDFIGEKIQEGTGAKKEEPAQDNRNIIEQYSPELKQFIEGQIEQGRSPIEAGALAQNTGKFVQIIKKLTQDHKAPWSAILESIYGGAGQAQPQQGQPQQQMQPGQQQQSGQAPVSEKLMGMIQQSMEARKRR